MSNKSDNNRNRLPYRQKNSLESLSDLGGGALKGSSNAFKDIGGGIFDQIMGKYDNDEFGNIGESRFNDYRNQEQEKKKKKEIHLFDYQKHYEDNIIKQEIKELTELIKRELEMIKKADKSLLQEAKDIEKLTINGLPEKAGIYHVRFLEIVLNILKTLKAKINESRTWLQAMTSKRKKRGSLFASRSKKQGTLYSMSQELSSSRSVQ